MIFPDGSLKDGIFEENIYVGPSNRIANLDDLNYENVDLAKV